jgi:hypothetical protein
MARKGTKKLTGITLATLPSYRGYIFVFFSEATLRLCAGSSLEDLKGQNVGDVVKKVNECIAEEIESIRGRGGDPCARTPLPLTGNDPKEKMNICYAHKVLTEVIGGSSPKTLTLPPALSLEFAEFVRSFMGPGKAKRYLFTVSEDVLALAVIGAHILQAYRGVNGEYGYVYIDVVPHEFVRVKARDVQRAVKRVTRVIAERGGSVASVLLGIAATASLILGDMAREIVKKDGHVIANYIRISRTGNKVMLKGFDSVDIIQLIKILRASGTSGATYVLLRSYPPEEFNNLRRFVEVLSQNLLKFQSFRKPIYIYEILRFLTSEELNREGLQYYRKKNEKSLGWSEIVTRLRGLARLVL